MSASPRKSSKANVVEAPSLPDILNPIPADDFDLFFSDEDLDEVLNASPEANSSFAPEVSNGALALARTLGAQYAEVIAHYAVDAIMGRSSKHAPKLREVVQSLVKLAVEMGDTEILAIYEQLGALIESFAQANTREERAETTGHLRDWVMTFSNYVEDGAAKKLRRLVVFRRGVHPLISHLREIRGLGAARLERLYTAGLLTTESLVEADPLELAQVVGIPKNIAVKVVEASRHFFEQQRLSQVRSLQNAVVDVTRVLREMDPADDEHLRILAAVRETISGLERAVNELEATWKRKSDR